MYESYLSRPRGYDLMTLLCIRIRDAGLINPGGGGIFSQCVVQVTHWIKNQDGVSNIDNAFSFEDIIISTLERKTRDPRFKSESLSKEDFFLLL